MKLNLWTSLIMPILFLFLIGCSSTYTVKNMGSKEELIKDFNNSAQNKKLQVILTNDSVLVVPEGAQIKNDSMLLSYSPNYYPAKIKKYKILPLTEINQAAYTNHWKAIIPGMVSGLFIGGIIGSTSLIFNYKEDGNHPDKNIGADVLMGGLSGMVIGSIVGAIIGWDNIYQFKP